RLRGGDRARAVAPPAELRGRKKLGLRRHRGLRKRGSRFHRGGRLLRRSRPDARPPGLERVEMVFAADVETVAVEDGVRDEPLLALAPVAQGGEALDLVLGDLLEGAARLQHDRAAVVAEHVEMLSSEGGADAAAAGGSFVRGLE